MGGFDYLARLFEPETGRILYGFIEPERIYAMVFTRDGKKVLKQPTLHGVLGFFGRRAFAAHGLRRQRHDFAIL